MKKAPQHHHIFVIKSCLKSPESSRSTGYQVETENSSWMRQCGDEYLVDDETLPYEIATMAVTTKKEVRFAKLARCKATLALEQFTKQEYRDTWYSRRELRALNRRSERTSDDDGCEVTSDDDDDANDIYPQSSPPAFSCSRQSKPSALACHLPTSKGSRTSSLTLRGRTNQPSAKPISSSEDRARLMGLTTYTTHPPPSVSTHKTKIFPNSSSGVVNSGQEEDLDPEEEEDWVKNEPRAFSARNRQSSSIFCYMKQKIKRRSASIMPNKNNFDMTSGASIVTCARRE